MLLIFFDLIHRIFTIGSIVRMNNVFTNLKSNLTIKLSIMNTQDNVKELVRQKYSEIALQDKETNESSCCGSGCCSTEVYNIMADDYTNLEGYNADADLGLGCGLPTQFAKIKKGDVVIDLGSGAGNDAFIARNETGETGKVIGIDFTPAMIERARKNAEARGVHNVEFRQGDIEKMPVTSNIADVIVSNCVLNLVPNKDSVFKEIFRALKPGGHFSISDVVLEGGLPKQIKDAAEMYAGCIAGAIQKQDYLDLIKANGFVNTTVQKDKAIVVPDDILSSYLSAKQIEEFKQSGTGIRSITVYAEKPAVEKEACCGPSCCN
jgi:SAM-dependent methyltransferase